MIWPLQDRNPYARPLVYAGYLRTSGVHGSLEFRGEALQKLKHGGIIDTLVSICQGVPAAIRRR